MTNTADRISTATSITTAIADNNRQKSHCYDDMDVDIIGCDDEIHGQNSFTNWVQPKSLAFFDAVNYDVDSITVVGDCDLTWLSPPREFQCRLNIARATYVNDNEVKKKKKQSNKLTSDGDNNVTQTQTLYSH